MMYHILLCYIWAMRDYSSNTDKHPESIRKDASANRKSIVVAARKLFAGDSADVTLSEIAKKANVSRATLYRNFQDKESVMVAVVNYNLDLLEKLASMIEGSDDRFFQLLDVIVEQHQKFHALATAMPQDQVEIGKRLFDIFRAPIAEAIANGSLRQDFTLEKDLLLVITMLGGALNSPVGRTRTESAKRAIELITQGVRRDS